MEWSQHADAITAVLAQLDLQGLRSAALVNRQFAELTAQPSLWAATLPGWWRCSLELELAEGDVRWRCHALAVRLSDVSAWPADDIERWPAIFRKAAELPSDLWADMVFSRALAHADDGSSTSAPSPYCYVTCQSLLAQLAWRRGQHKRARALHDAAVRCCDAGVIESETQAEVRVHRALFLLTLEPATASEGRAELRRAMEHEPDLGELFMEVGREQLESDAARTEDEEGNGSRPGPFERCDWTAEGLAASAAAHTGPPWLPVIAASRQKRIERAPWPGAPHGERAFPPCKIHTVDTRRASQGGEMPVVPQSAGVATAWLRCASLPQCLVKLPTSRARSLPW
jgi:hypothetical protein